MSGYLGQAYPTPFAEICATGHCDYFRWGAAVCIATWDQINAAGGQAAYCAVAPSAPVQPVMLLPPVTELVTIAPPAPVHEIIVPLPKETAVPSLAITCPIEYPIGHWDQYGQLICERPRGLELIPVPVAYGAQRAAPIPRPGQPVGYTAAVAVPSAQSAPLAAVVPAPPTTPLPAAVYTVPAAPPVSKPWLDGIPNWAVLGGGLALTALAARGARA